MKLQAGFISLVAALFLSECCSLVAYAELLPPTLSTPETKESAAVKTQVISQDARTLAKQIGVMPYLEEISRLPADAALKGSTETRFSVLFLRQTITELLLTTTYEVRSTCNHIDKELAETNKVLAYEAERRDRAVRLNTYANFISGGVSGMIRGSLKLGNVCDIAPEVIEAVEGSIQTSLASWALRQQHGDKRLEENLPNTLAKIMVVGGSRPPEFPESVWTYLNTNPEKYSSTRRVKLLADWSKLRMCLVHAGHRGPEQTRTLRLGQQTTNVQKITIDVLEDRVAMLTELRTLILNMDALLLEMMEVVRGKRAL